MSDASLMNMKARKIRVAFQGELGAYSESAVRTFFGSKVEAKPCIKFSDVFKSVEQDESEFGLVPIENSTEGSVNQTYDLLLDYDLKICGETVLKIDHCLVAHQQTALRAVKVVYSHPQALAQCGEFLQRLGCELVPSYDTAGSVKMIRERGLKDSAAVASKRAAELYKMKVLAKGIADNPNNYTRFLILSEKDAKPTGKDKTSVVLSIRHVPGSLYKALGELAKRNINLTRIESRPTKRTPWEYNIYIDFEGHRKDDKCTKVLKGLEQKTSFIKVLGSYPKATLNIDETI